MKRPPQTHQKVEFKLQAKNTIEYYQKLCKISGTFILLKPFPRSYWLLYHKLEKLFEESKININDAKNMILEYKNKNILKGDYFEILNLIKEK